MISGMGKVVLGGLAAALGLAVASSADASPDTGGEGDFGDTPSDPSPISYPLTEAQIPAAVAQTPAEIAADESYDHSAANLNELKAEIQKQTDPTSRAILEAELKRLTGA